MKEYESRLIYDAGCTLGEGPVYDETEEVLYFVDIQEARIHCLDLKSESHHVIQLDRPLGSMVLTDKGNILVAMDNGIYMYQNQSLEPYCLMPEASPENIRFNDGKCDPAGRFIAGTQVDPNDAEQGCLFSIDRPGCCRVLAKGLGCSNGLAWSLDGKKMYHIDTLVQKPSRIYGYDYDPGSGAVSNKREVIDYSPLAERGILADGMTIDANGNLWIAEWGGYGIGCWDPDTGKKLAHVNVPVKKVSCCTFGGKEYRTLFITTAEGNEIYAGGIFAADVETYGFPAIRFQESSY